MEQLGRKDLADLLHALKIERLPGDPELSSNWPAYEGLPNVVFEQLRARRIPNSALAHGLLLNVTTYLGWIADYQGAGDMALAVRNLIEARLPGVDRLVGMALANHGLALIRLDDLAGALALLERAAGLDEVHRPGSAELADQYDTLGGVLLAQGRAGKAGALVKAARRRQQALALRRLLFGRSALLAQTVNNLGAVRFAQGRGAAAARLANASLMIFREVLPPGDARLA